MQGGFKAHDVRHAVITYTMIYCVRHMYVYVYTYIYIYIHTYTCVYIYIYREREREIDRYI